MPLPDIALPLFLPATRLDRLTKALAAGPDAVILDLEDAVPGDRKDDARAALLETLTQAPALPLLVRINAAGSPAFDADMAACAAMPLVAVMLPKAQDPAMCADVAARTGKPVVGLVETALGLHRAVEVAGACARLAFGSIDYAADLGIAHGQQELGHARAALVLASRLAGLSPPWDGVTVAATDPEAVTADCRHSVAMGFGGKLLIHPAQIAPARAAMAPSDTDCAWAERVLAAAADTDGAIKLDGEMIDPPVILRARQILARAARAGQHPER